MRLQRFEDYLYRRMEDDTVGDYLRRFHSVYDVVSPFTPAKINAYLLAKKKTGVQANSINVLIRAIRAYCRANNLSWGKEIEYFVEEETHKDIFTDQEIELFLGLKKPPYFQHDKWKRWTLFFTILAFSGMRGNEVAKLTVLDIDFTSNNFVLQKTKTVPRRVPIAANVRPLLEQYLPTCSHYLFPSAGGSRPHIWRAAWQKHFNIRKQLLGFKKTKLTTHSFRHSHATNLYDNGVQLLDIMKIEGHKRYETALKYIHLSDKSAQKAINKHSVVKKWTSPEEMFRSYLEEALKAGLLDETKIGYVIEPHFFAIWEKGKKHKKLEFTDDE